MARHPPRSSASDRVEAPAGLRRSPGGLLLNVRVTPRAPRTVVGGARDNRLLVRVTAAPVDNAANEAAVRAVADALGVSRGRVRVAAGATSRNKTLEITAGDEADLSRRLAALLQV